MKKRNVTAIILTVALTSVTLLGGCGSDKGLPGSSVEAADATSAELKKITIGYVDSGASFPDDALAIAIDQGYIEEEFKAIGYEAELIPFTGAGPAINEALVNGSIDAATTGDVPAINGKSKGIDITLLAGEILYNDAALVVPADSDITSVSDLKGKTVATLQGSYMHKTLINMLEDTGLSFADINFSSMPSADAAAAVEAKAVDAALVANTQEAALAKSENVRIVKNCENNPEWKGGHAIVIRSEYLKENRAAAVALLKVYKRAYNYSIANYDSAITSLAKSGATAEAYRFFFPSEVNFNLSAGADAVEAYNDIKQFLLDNELLANDFDISAWIDASVWEEAVIDE